MKHTPKIVFYSFFILMISPGSNSFAQSIARSVISSGGNYSANSNGALYANVGELQINNFSTTGYYLTEGFVQPEIYLPVTVASHDAQLYAVSVFPNPATCNIFIVCTDDKINSVEVFDTQGRKVYEDKTITASAKEKLSINITELNKGIYFIKVITSRSLERRMRFVKM